MSFKFIRQRHNVAFYIAKFHFKRSGTKLEHGGIVN